MVTWAEHKAEQKAWRNMPPKKVPVTSFGEIKQYGNTRPPWIRLRVPQQHPGRNRLKREAQRENARDLDVLHGGVMVVTTC